jgi:hypothetical protein
MIILRHPVTQTVLEEHETQEKARKRAAKISARVKHTVDIQENGVCVAYACAGQIFDARTGRTIAI